jgi:Mn2+/Fe2+ NRAMP family transporter
MKHEESRLRRALGPGLITGASDDDPSGILTYLQSGVVLGLNALWTAFITLPLMYGIQEMCGRIGYVTRKGLMQILRERHSKALIAALALLYVAAIILNIGADMLAMGTVVEDLTSVSRLVWMPLFSAAILLAVIFLSYRKFASVLRWLTFSLFFYIGAALMGDIDWGAAFRAMVWPEVPWTAGNALLIAAIMGTTISPYLFFWQANEEVEERAARTGPGGLKNALRNVGYDTFWGMLFSNVTMWFIIASATGISGVHEIRNFEDAALALRPLLGEAAYFMFALGIVGTGFLAIPVLAGNVGYALAELFGWEEGMNLTFRAAPGFYLAMIGATVMSLSLAFVNVDPVTLLIYSAVFYTLITPPIIFLIMSIANDKKVLGRSVNTPLSNLLGWSCFGLMAVVAAGYVLSLFGP